MGKKEIIIVGDVIKSRKKFDPEKWQYFHKSIKAVNKKFKKVLKIPLTVYSGDSFGGICKDVESASNLILAIQEYSKYHTTRIILVKDEINYGLNKKSFLTLEGPALWRSKTLIQKLKTNQTYFLAKVEGELLNVTLNTILNLIIAIRNDWNEIEWEVYKSSSEDMKQKELARKLKVSQQYVSKIIKTSKLKIVKEAEANLKTILNGINNSIYNK